MTAASAPSKYLDRDTLVRAAADLADREGWSALTLSAVAKEVDRHVSSMYAHVDGLPGLRRAIAALALDELSDRVWRAAIGKVQGDALLAIADVYREFAIAHPGRVAAIATERDPDDEEVRARAIRLAEPVRATFKSFGLDDDRAAVAHRVFSATVTGFTRSSTDVDDFHQAVALFVAGLSAGTWPTS